jgi:hypothetical protein
MSYSQKGTITVVEYRHGSMHSRVYLALTALVTTKIAVIEVCIDEIMTQLKR